MIWMLGLYSIIFKFAGDTMLATSVKDVHASFKLQGDLDKLIAMAEKWQMKFNGKVPQTPTVIF